MGCFLLVQSGELGELSSMSVYTIIGFAVHIESLLAIVCLSAECVHASTRRVVRTNDVVWAASERTTLSVCMMISEKKRSKERLFL